MRVRAMIPAVVLAETLRVDSRGSARRRRVSVFLPKIYFRCLRTALDQEMLRQRWAGKTLSSS